MNQASAQLRYLHMAPRKVRLIADLIRGLPVGRAEAELMLGTRRRAAEPLLKLLRSCVANAVNRKLQPTRLYISTITVDQGPMFKRSLPRAMGRATPIQKKMSHIHLVLSEGTVAHPKYTIAPKKKKEEPKAKRVSKASAPTDNRPADNKDSQRENAGFFKRIFSRKSV